MISRGCGNPETHKTNTIQEDKLTHTDTYTFSARGQCDKNVINSGSFRKRYFLGLCSISYKCFENILTYNIFLAKQKYFLQKCAVNSILNAVNNTFLQKVFSMLLNGIHLTNFYSVFRIDLFEKWLICDFLFLKFSTHTSMCN